MFQKILLFRSLELLFHPLCWWIAEAQHAALYSEGTLITPLPKLLLHLTDRIRSNPHIGGEKKKGRPIWLSDCGYIHKAFSRKKKKKERKKKKEEKVVALLNDIYINDMNDRLKGKIINLSFQLFFYCPTLYFIFPGSRAIKPRAEWELWRSCSQALLEQGAASGSLCPRWDHRAPRAPTQPRPPSLHGTGEPQALRRGPGCPEPWGSHHLGLPIPPCPVLEGITRGCSAPVFYGRTTLWSQQQHPEQPQSPKGCSLCWQ